MLERLMRLDVSFFDKDTIVCRSSVEINQVCVSMKGWKFERGKRKESSQLRLSFWKDDHLLSDHFPSLGELSWLVTSLTTRSRMIAKCSRCHFTCSLAPQSRQHGDRSRTYSEETTIQPQLHFTSGGANNHYSLCSFDSPSLQVLTTRCSTFALQ